MNQTLIYQIKSFANPPFVLFRRRRRAQTNADNIAYLRTNDANYSPTFRLLLNQSPNDALLRPQRTSSGMAAARELRAASPRDAEARDRDALALRHRRLTAAHRDAVQSEIEATDARIRRYTEQQFAALQRFRERAAAELGQLVKLAGTVRHDGAEPASAMDASAALVTAKPLLEATPPATPDAGTPMSIGNSPNFISRPQQSLDNGAAAPVAVPSTSVTVTSSGGATSLLATSLSRAIPFKARTVSYH